MILLRRALGPYRLIEVIRQDKSVIVYKGYCPKQERWVVINTIRRKPVGFTVFPTAHFEQFFQTVAGLRHPNILSVFDYGYTANLAYLVSDYIPASILTRRMVFGIDLRTALDITLQLADALSHAHDHGVVHGNITPSRILLAVGDWPLLADFGLQILLRLNSNAALPDQRQYLLANQWRDIYALGMVLYEILAGTATSRIESELAEPPLPLSFYCPGIPQEVEAITMKATTRDPNYHYWRINNMIHDLQKTRALLFGQNALPEWPENGLASIRPAPPSQPEIDTQTIIPNSQLNKRECTWLSLV